MTDWNKIVFEYVCPSVGILISAALYSAPVKSLAEALENKSLGSLNPTPWTILTGNCFGLVIFAYYTNDPFVLAGNIPGVFVSLWLNSGASRLQYYEEVQKEESSSPSNSSNKNAMLIMTPQDQWMLGILGFWTATLVCIGWLGIGSGREAGIIGILVNINLLCFYAAPLQTIHTVIFVEKSSSSIHTWTTVMNCANSFFWGSYGFAINSIAIYAPNVLGFLLGLIQAALCCAYPKTSTSRSRKHGVTIHHVSDDKPPLDSASAVGSEDR